MKKNKGTKKEKGTKKDKGSSLEVTNSDIGIIGHDEVCGVPKKGLKPKLNLQLAKQVATVPIESTLEANKMMENETLNERFIRCSQHSWPSLN